MAPSDATASGDSMGVGFAHPTQRRITTNVRTTNRSPYAVLVEESTGRSRTPSELTYAAPGPLAAQLAIYLGWVRPRLLGATLVAIAFILPSFVMVLGLATAYVSFGGVPWMQGVFYGPRSGQVDAATTLTQGVTVISSQGPRAFVGASPFWKCYCSDRVVLRRRLERFPTPGSPQRPTAAGGSKPQTASAARGDPAGCTRGSAAGR
ncbi:MAG: chromate transporter [Thermoleophilia bacterium]|nr:chromate transporter [Thermoleophilia bacterium]